MENELSKLSQIANLYLIFKQNLTLKYSLWCHLTSSLSLVFQNTDFPFVQKILFLWNFSHKRQKMSSLLFLGAAVPFLATGIQAEPIADFPLCTCHHPCSCQRILFKLQFHILCIKVIQQKTASMSESNPKWVALFSAL